MILDSGTCYIYEVTGTAFKPSYKLKHVSYYGDLDYSSDLGRYAPMSTGLSKDNPSGNREDVEITKRVRILQNKELSTRDAVYFVHHRRGKQYDIVRLYHGYDKESGELITDMSLTARSDE